MRHARIAVLIALAVALVALAPAVGGAGTGVAAPAAAAVKAAPPDPAARPLALARRLSASWGRCAHARPAHRLLAIAARTRPVRPRVLRARAAVRAWRGVVSDCRKPVAMPTIIIVLDGGYVLGRRPSRPASHVRTASSTPAP